MLQPVASQGGDLSQDSVRGTAHRSPVAEKVSQRMDDPASRRTRGMYQALSASSVGLELGVSVLIGLLGGLWLDGKAGTDPWLMIAGVMLGLVAGFRGVLKAVERSDKAAAAEEKRRG